MKFTKNYIPTLREVPQEAVIPSHQLLLRTGHMRKTVSGVYSYLPLGLRVIKKIEKIVREEMDAIDSVECLLSAVQPRELWDESGRWENFGPEMFQLKDRNEREFCLGPTAEEYFTALIKDEVNSYKQLPLSLYQIQTKYRDEKRPRFGLIRGREFIMKDAYTFDKDEESMKKSYEKMLEAYIKIFDRMKLRYRIVGGDTGTMGGKIAHEFIALSEVGEGVIAYSEDSDFASTDEACEVIYNVADENSPPLELEKVHTPDCKTIEELCDYLKIKSNMTVKNLVFKVKDEIVLVLIPGDRELNLTKLLKHLGVQDFDCEMADAEQIRKAINSEAGYIGPVGLLGVKVILDERVSRMKNFFAGANEKDYHYKNVNYGRDFSGEIVKDLLMVEEGDICPESGKPLKLDRGIEVGNIFQLGTKYSDSLNATFLDENGKAKPFVMGSYGVGISRTMSAIVEQYHDENGIIWPLATAPFHVIITVVNMKKDEQRLLGEELERNLEELGIEVLLDDRNERAGVKFTDRDLIGIPLRITVGKTAAEREVEFSLRSNMDENFKLSLEEAVEKVKEILKSEGLL